MEGQVRSLVEQIERLTITVTGQQERINMLEQLQAQPTAPASGTVFAEAAAAMDPTTNVPGEDDDGSSFSEPGHFGSAGKNCSS